MEQVIFVQSFLLEDSMSLSHTNIKSRIEELLEQFKLRDRQFFNVTQYLIISGIISPYSIVVLVDNANENRLCRVDCANIRCRVSKHLILNYLLKCFNLWMIFHLGYYFLVSLILISDLTLRFFILIVFNVLLSLCLNLPYDEIKTN